MMTKPPECTGCPLEKKGTGFSKWEGKGSIGVLAMAEALGEHEAKAGLPLRPEAPAGSVFERAIKRVGLDREQFIIGNTCQCQPPANVLEGASYEMEAITHCGVHRDKMIDAAKRSGAKVILAMGNVPLRTLTGMSGKKKTVSSLRGYVIESFPDVGLPVVPTYHPSFIRRGATNMIGVLMRDIMFAASIARNGFQQEIPKYQTAPSIDDAQSFLYRVKDNANLLLAYDIENPKSAAQAEDEIKHEEMKDQPITQVQLSLAVGEGICLPWVEPYISIFRDCMASPNLKAGHNVWKYDNPILTEKYGVEINGRIHDTRWAWHHLQPDLPADLQFTASFYNFPFPWKHMAGEDLAFYGCADVDSVQRIMAKILIDLEKRGILQGYLRKVFDLEPILSNMKVRGIPIDDEYRETFGGRIQETQKVIGEKIQKAVPLEVFPVHPKEGYKKPPKDVEPLISKCAEEAALENRNFGTGTVIPLPEPKTIAGNEVTALMYRPFNIGIDQSTMAPIMENRWCYTRTFSPNASKQLISYMKAKGHPIPIELKGGKDGEDRETTEAEELKKLAKKTGDKFYLDCIEWRKLGKMHSTYVLGWSPDKRTGRVHPTFSYGPATAQLNSVEPNAQNFPKHSKLAMEARGIVCAPDGYNLHEIDYHAFHAQTLALEAGCPDYLRLARADVHSFLAAQLLHLPDAGRILSMKDDEMLDYLGHVKKHHKFVRDKKAKPAILGYGFGLQAKHMWEMNAEVYDPETDSYVVGIESKKEAQKIIDMIDSAFPRLKKFRDMIRMQAHQQTYLLGRHQFIRWFWDVYHWDKKAHKMVPGEDGEKAIAFLPANDAFGHMREVMLALRETICPKTELSLEEKYGLISNIHDSLIFCCKKEYSEELNHVVPMIMERKSTVLSHPVVAPDGFWCDVEAEVGKRWNDMAKVKRHAA